MADTDGYVSASSLLPYGRLKVPESQIILTYGLSQFNSCQLRTRISVTARRLYDDSAVLMSHFSGHCSRSTIGVKI